MAWARWRRRLLVFSTGQMSVQLLAFVTGLLVLRWMSADEYAKAGVVFGFQTLFTAFVDLGVGGALRAGKRKRHGSKTDDKRKTDQMLPKTDRPEGAVGRIGGHVRLLITRCHL